MILLAPDKFKGTLDSAQASRAMIRGLRRALSPEHWDFKAIIMADGGEGTPAALDAHIAGAHCQYYTFDAPEGPSALVMSCELAGAVMASSTPVEYRTSETLGAAVAQALSDGYEHVYIGVGGTMLADAGRGMLEALKGFKPNFLRRRLTGLCDVSCPLLPERPGELSALSFLAQKGYSAAQILERESFFRRELSAAGGKSGRFDGAGGGIGFALGTVLGARCISGARFIAGRHEDLFAHADLVLTGEGCIDAQTSGGKAVEAVADLAHKYGCRVVAFGGKVPEAPDGVECQACGPESAPVPRDASEAALQLACAVEKWARTRSPQ